MDIYVIYKFFCGYETFLVCLGVYKRKLNTFVKIILCLQNQTFKQFTNQ